jgi:hypothetical protein
MTDPREPDLHAVDAAARAASRGLHDHVARRVDPELLLAALPADDPPRRNGRLLAAAAVAALFIGSVAVLGDGSGGDDRSRLELDEDGNKLPAPEPGTLTPLGPNDGLDSIQLPITVEPNVDLRDGDVVTASGPGFVPGEQVGIVQCAREAGGEVREQRAGIDGCDIGSVHYADADGDGVATGTFTVRRILTTPATGTVDCALEAERCIVAMGAISDYDRSGGFGVAFAGGGEPIDIPTISVSPVEGLADGDVVRVDGEGFEPNAPLTLSICSIDPGGCWSTGEPIKLNGENMIEHGGDSLTGLLADGQGRVRGDVPVWRFLPAPTAGAYIDCAVSTCRLRVTAEAGYSPAPPILGFDPGGTAPQPPAVAVDPTQDLEPGDEIVVRGAGFEPGVHFSVELCAAPPGDPTSVVWCSGHGGDEQIDDDGGFAILFEVPDPDDAWDMSDGGMASTTTQCATSGECPPPPTPAGAPCDGAQLVCSIRVQSYQDGQPVGPPQFAPEPVVVTLRT